MSNPQQIDAPGAPSDTTDQLSAIYREEVRIARQPGELWPDTPHLTTDEYIAFLKRVPTGSGMRGYLATWRGENHRVERMPR